MTPKTNKVDYTFVYRKDFAMTLISLGHEVFATMPNPQKNKLIMWVFYKTPMLEEDLRMLKEGGARND